MYCKNTGIDPDTQYVADVAASQSGVPGQTVSDGLWVYNGVRFDQAPTECPDGYALDHIAFQWNVSTIDFAQYQHWGSGEIDYYPP